MTTTTVWVSELRERQALALKALPEQKLKEYLNRLRRAGLVAKA